MQAAWNIPEFLEQHYQCSPNTFQFIAPTKHTQAGRHNAHKHSNLARESSISIIRDLKEFDSFSYSSKWFGFTVLTKAATVSLRK